MTHNGPMFTVAKKNGFVQHEKESGNPHYNLLLYNVLGTRDTCTRADPGRQPLPEGRSHASGRAQAAFAHAPQASFPAAVRVRPYLPCRVSRATPGIRQC